MAHLFKLAIAQLKRLYCYSRMTPPEQEPEIMENTAVPVAKSLRRGNSKGNIKKRKPSRPHKKLDSETLQNRIKELEKRKASMESKLLLNCDRLDKLLYESSFRENNNATEIETPA